MIHVCTPAAALLLTGFAAAQPVPTSACDFDGFNIDAQLAEVKAASPAYYGCATGKCLPMRLRPGDPVVMNRSEGDWTCGYLVARDGAAQGWIRSNHIRPIPADPNPPVTAFIGTWLQESNRMRIRASKTAGSLELTGEASWHGRRGSVNTGEVSAVSAPQGNKLHFQDDACRIDLALLGRFILANDNNMCGGANVRFWGIWKRAAATAPGK